ncbi:MAG: NTP transferase domain-containing protein [Candidatus Freyarchaeota archaeon]|nr:NTP transferase domain-containing protein [Candidatus Jordarchaeia archaeon]
MRRVDGLIMAGGRGSRFGAGEKPLVRVNGRPMIDYVAAAMSQARLVRRVYATVTPHTPKTAEHLEEAWRGRITLIETPGVGYVEDLKHLVAQIRFSAILVCPADMPLLRGDLLDLVAKFFLTGGKPSLVVVVPLRLVTSLGLEPTLVMNIGGEDFVPSGVNALNGVEAASGKVLEECYLKVGLEEFAVNVNTINDLEVAEKLLSQKGWQRLRSSCQRPMKKSMNL